VKTLRRWHLYLGVLFAPIIVFFAITGMLQTFGLHEGSGANAWIAHAAAIHKDARWSLQRGAEPSHPLQFFVLCMAIGLVVSSAIGVYMAWSMRKQRVVVIALLAAGALLPVIALAL
jgi:hypothetical protein